MKEYFVIIVSGYLTHEGMRVQGELEAKEQDTYPSPEAIEHELIVHDARYARIEKRHKLA